MSNSFSMRNYVKLPLLTLFIALVILPLYAQKGANLALVKEQLCKKWHYSKCRILGIEYISSKEEQNDMIHFGNDMTYEFIEGGKTQKGTWSYMPDKKKIRLLDKKNKVVKELKVEKLTSSEFVYTVTMNWQYEVSMFMTTEILN